MLLSSVCVRKVWFWSYLQAMDNSKDLEVLPALHFP